VRRHYLDDLHNRLRELWAQGRPVAAYGAARGGAARSFQPRLKPGQKAWEVPQPASPQLRAAAGAATTAAAAERRERMILLSAINHPEVLHDFWEDLAGLEFTARVLDSLRTLILDVASSEEALDRAALKTHLIAKGFGPDLDRLEDQAKRLNEWFLGPLAASDDARTGLRQMIALHRKTVTLDRELKAAEAAFAREPSEANLATLIAVRDQLSSANGAEALIEGFGAASGRGAGEAM
jgi:DNA primase